MSAATAPHSIAHMIAHVQAKASQDTAFRAAFLKDPKGVAELEFGMTMPDLAQVQAVEAPADTVVVVLPHSSTMDVLGHAAPAADGEMSDSELEAVAGGSKQGAKDFFSNPRVIGSAAAAVALGAVTYGVGAIPAGTVCAIV